MNKVFIVEWDVQAKWIIATNTDFIVSVIDDTFEAVAEAIINSKEVFSKLEWANHLEYNIRKVEELSVY